MAFVAGRVAPHMQVRACELIDAIPKSPSGKLLRRVLVERERERELTYLRWGMWGSAYLSFFYPRVRHAPPRESPRSGGAPVAPRLSIRLYLRSSASAVRRWPSTPSCWQ